MTVLSTKKLKPNQRELLINAGVSFVAYDAIEIKPVAFTLSRKLENVIFTSQNGANAFLNSGVCSSAIEHCFCVGEKTTALLTKKDLKVIKKAKNGADLAHFIAKTYKNEQFTYFCGKQRRDELPRILKEADISCNEVVVYETHLIEKTFTQVFDGVLFFSPSGVQSFIKVNHPSTMPRVQADSNTKRGRSGAIAFVIGETTATAAREHFETVIVSNATTIESTIAKAVNYLKNNSN